MTGERLRFPDLPSREELSLRPVRTVEELRDERRAIEDALLRLVPAESRDDANRLLDAMTLNGIDTSAGRTARMEKRLRHRAEVEAREAVLADWVALLPPDEAVQRAANEVRSLIPRGGEDDASGQRVAAKAMINLAATYDAWVAHRLDSGEAVATFRKRVIDLLRGRARDGKGGAARALNRAADAVGSLPVDLPSDRDE